MSNGRHHPELVKWVQSRYQSALTQQVRARETGVGDWIASANASAAHWARRVERLTGQEGDGA